MNTYETIKSLRQQMHMSQDELARKTGYSDRSSIAKIEAGKVDLSESKIALFAAALDVSPAQLMGISSNMPSSTPSPVLTPDETQLVTDYRSMNAEGKTAALAAVHGLASTDLYKKHNDSSDLLEA